MRPITCRFCGQQNLVGVVSCENCGAELFEGVPESPVAYEGRLLGTRLVSIATGEPLLLDAAMDALAAVRRMKADGADCVLVTDAGRLAGIFTDRDAILKLAGQAGSAPTLRDLMTPDPVVLSGEDRVAVAIHKMAVGGFRHIPLVDADGPTAVIAARDLFRHLAAGLD